MSKNLSQERVNELYENYRKEGGFGVYSVDRLCARNVNIEEKIYQENTIMDLYSAVYDQEINKSKLENYLSRKCTGAYERCSLQLKNGIPKECFVQGKDPFITFTKLYRVDGHVNRMYWKEKNIERGRFTAKELIIKKEEKEEEEEEYIWSQPTLTRSSSSTKLI